MATIEIEPLEVKLMKKLLTVAFISFILISSASSLTTTNNKTLLSNAASHIASINNGIFNRVQQEQIYRDLSITMLYPHVEKAIDNYYSDYMTYLPHEDPYSYEFVKIDKTPGKNYDYTIVIEVLPYVGPHLSVGKDQITFKIDLDGVKFEKFEHLESYELPPYYQNIIKKKLP